MIQQRGVVLLEKIQDDAREIKCSRYFRMLLQQLQKRPVNGIGLPGNDFLKIARGLLEMNNTKKADGFHAIEAGRFVPSKRRTFLGLPSRMITSVVFDETNGIKLIKPSCLSCHPVKKHHC